MEYKGYNIKIEEATKFTVRVTAAAALVDGSGEKDYTVESNKMIYAASCDAGIAYNVSPEDALNAVKKLIDNLK